MTGGCHVSGIAVKHRLLSQGGTIVQPIESKRPYYRRISSSLCDSSRMLSLILLTVSSAKLSHWSGSAMFESHLGLTANWG